MSTALEGLLGRQGVAAVQLVGGEHELPHLAFADDVDPQNVQLVKPPA